MKEPKRTPWDATLSVVHDLRKEGHTALLAGGCVRDRLLGLDPQDYDVATDAIPEVVCKIFPRAKLVGVKFGVVVVRRFGHAIEVATFRSEGAYSDGRRPDKVVFGGERDDALRRDFTINGLFYDPIADKVIDHVQGLADLKSKIIRAIGSPDIRFAEDHLRMLRAVRLSARLGFAIEPQTFAAIQSLAPHLRSISPERIWMELEQIFSDPSRTNGWTLLHELGLRPHLSDAWPVDPVLDGRAGLRLAALPQEKLDPALPLAAVLAEMEPDQVSAIGRSLRLSNDLIGKVLWLVRHLSDAYQASNMELADFKILRASPNWGVLLDLFKADLCVTRADPSVYHAAQERGRLVPLALAAPEPLVTGDDLIRMGLTSGPKMGEILRAVYRAQLNETIETRDQAIAMARELGSH